MNAAVNAAGLLTSLTEGLAAVQAALAEERVADAATAAEGVIGTCEALARSGTPIPPPVLARARELQLACAAAAQLVRERVRDGLEAVGAFRRAAGSYRRQVGR